MEREASRRDQQALLVSCMFELQRFVELQSKSNAPNLSISNYSMRVDVIEEAKLCVLHPIFNTNRMSNRGYLKRIQVFLLRVCLR